ncbi:MAG: PAS domain S-box protein, partial [Chloroflexi bacterium]|nr:PAS domain S-box protein [Chloroflexota bacterium]
MHVFLNGLEKRLHMSERRESPVTQGATEVRSESVLGHEGYTGELEKALELDTASSIDGRAEFERRERALKESEEKFRMIFEHANDGIIYLDESCTIIDVNPRVEEMFGTKREDLVGKGFSEKGFVLPHLVPRILSELDRALGSGFGDLIEIEARRMDGSPIFLEASLRVIVREGGDRRLIALLRD